jgi:hypothetical protein
MVATYIIPYMHGNVDPWGRIDEESKARCRKAVAVGKKLQGEVYIVLGCGRPRYCEGVGREVTLADGAKDFILHEGWGEDAILAKPSGSTTFTETCAVLELLLSRLSQEGEGGAVIGVVTTNYHAPRVLWTWNLLMPNHEIILISSGFTEQPWWATTKELLGFAQTQLEYIAWLCKCLFSSSM